MEDANWVTGQLQQLAAEFAGWRVGRGGSGNWWAVRRNECVRTQSLDDLRAQLRQRTSPHSS